jgi:hypothetical protein
MEKSKTGIEPQRSCRKSSFRFEQGIQVVQNALGGFAARRGDPVAAKYERQNYAPVIVDPALIVSRKVMQCAPRRPVSVTGSRFEQANESGVSAMSSSWRNGQSRRRFSVKQLVARDPLLPSEFPADRFTSDRQNLPSRSFPPAHLPSQLDLNRLIRRILSNCRCIIVTLTGLDSPCHTIPLVASRCRQWSIRMVQTA